VWHPAPGQDHYACPTGLGPFLKHELLRNTALSTQVHMCHILSAYTNDYVGISASQSRGPGRLHCRTAFLHFWAWLRHAHMERRDRYRNYRPRVG
jgi:hypothetical protein